MRKRNKKAGETRTNTIDFLRVMQAELDEGVQLLRPHYPEASNSELCSRAASLLRWQRYAQGRWPTAEEIEAEKAEVPEKGATADEAGAEAELLTAEGVHDEVNLPVIDE